MTARMMIAVLVQTAKILRLSNEEVASLMAVKPNKLGIWKTGKVDLHSFCIWAEVLGFEVIMKRKD
tara:strand:- start:367 stop:564 length:198 start_codon:yes stop_codon:yes gene_type:complete